MSGRRAGQRFDAAHAVTTEALVFLGELDPEAVGPSIEFATHYEPTPLADAERLLDAIPFPAEDATFVDVGSGMGRVLILAARRTFAQVVGVEISPALHEVARANLRRYADPRRQTNDIRLVRADAASFDYPRGDLVLYLYNPFRATVLQAVLDRVAPLGGRRLALLYHTPLEREVIEADRRFRLRADFGYARIYEREDA